MNEPYKQGGDDIESLRSRMDADARFRRVISGYDPYEVRVYVENVKRIFAQQAKASKQEQETLIAQMDSAKSEIQARNCAIKKLKDLVIQRESQLNAANERIGTLLQAVKKHEVERQELERLRAASASVNAVAQRVQSLQNETQQLRSALTQSSSLLESLRAERDQLFEENDQLKQELYYQRALTQRLAPEAPPRQQYTQPVAPVAPAAPVRQAYTEAPPVENRFAAQTATVQKDFSQVADKLANMFADAYLLISQFRNAEAQPEAPQPLEPTAQRPQQPFMQILRPDGAVSDNPLYRK